MAIKRTRQQQQQQQLKKQLIVAKQQSCDTCDNINDYLCCQSFIPWNDSWNDLTLYTLATKKYSQQNQQVIKQASAIKQ